VNDVPILHRNSGTGCCRHGFYRRTGSVGCESVSQEDGADQI